MTPCDEEKIVASGPSHRSQCGELTDRHAITMHSSQPAMRVMALTVRSILESYFSGLSGGSRGAPRFFLIARDDQLAGSTRFANRRTPSSFLSLPPKLHPRVFLPQNITLRASCICRGVPVPTGPELTVLRICPN